MKNEKTISNIKEIVGIASAIGAMIVTDNLVKSVTPATTGKITKIFVRLGTVALGSVAGALASYAVSKEIDGIVTTAKLVKDSVKGDKKADEDIESEISDSPDHIEPTEYPAADSGYSWDCCCNTAKDYDDYEEFCRAAERFNEMCNKVAAEMKAAEGEQNND
jgi:hypothetical protein